jgi:AcrR family transcriptional regulator
MGATMGLRERNRLAAMRLVQDTAVELFERDGYESTTIEAIAAASGVSTATIYRHFGNKETIVLWDERDNIINNELEQRLGQQPPLEAFRDAAIAAYDGRDDHDRFLRRLKLVYANPSILGVAAQNEARSRSELAAGLAAADGRRQPTIDDDVTAAIALATLDVAFTRWQRTDAQQGLGRTITDAYSAATNR